MAQYHFHDFFIECTTSSSCSSSSLGICDHNECVLQFNQGVTCSEDEICGLFDQIGCGAYVPALAPELPYDEFV